MGTKEKLLDVLSEAWEKRKEFCAPYECETCPYDKYPKNCHMYIMFDHLIASGVVVQRWISVSEPPKENGYYLCYVLTSAVGEKVKYEQMPLYWEDDIWLYRHNSYRMCRNVTHWMPLPPAPKGE